MTPKTLGDLVRRHRSLAGLSVEELAEAAEVSDSMIRHIESGRRNASHDVLGRISRALRLDTSQIEELEAARRRAKVEIAERESHDQRLSRIEAELVDVRRLLELVAQRVGVEP